MEEDKDCMVTILNTDRMIVVKTTLDLMIETILYKIASETSTQPNSTALCDRGFQISPIIQTPYRPLVTGLSEMLVIYLLAHH